MYKYPITIELLSETIFGNGQSKNGIVNTDILLDEEGFPYYLGKTFKGCLKKSIDTILKPFYEKKDKDKFSKTIENLFGYSKRLEQREGKIKFTNFYLDKAITDIFSDYRNGSNNSKREDLIISSLTDIRFSIKMGENGVTESKSLRASRVLKKGLVFNGCISTLDKLEEYELEILENGMKSLKNLGINKSRGKGVVDIKFSGNPHKDDKKIDYVNYDFDYILYEIYLNQPIKIGDSQSQYDYEQSKQYISGSIVRGAIINKYYKLKNEDRDFKDLLKKVYFYDCYPIYENGKEKYYSFPTPNIFRITKNTDKEDKDTYNKNEDFSIVFDNSNISRNEPAVIKLKKGEFAYYKNKVLYQFNIKKDYRFHHSQKMQRENIFRYESISKGQKFYGIVDVSNVNKNLKNEIYRFLNREEILYLGGSRTSGYGETEISYVKLIKDFDELRKEVEYMENSFDNDVINLYFLSDSILRDENHQVISCFSKEYLKKELEINIDKKDMEMEINPVILTGFNSKWKSYIPHVYGVEKGSVVKIDLNKDKHKVDENTINRFIKIQHGDRKQDGLGRMILNPKFLNCSKIKYLGTNRVCSYDREYSNFKFNIEFLNFIKQCRNGVILKNAIKMIVINKFMMNSASLELKDISKSKINNVISSIDRILFYDENPMKEFKKEIERLDTITQNKERNENNSKVLDYKLIGDITIRSLGKLGDEKLNEIVYDILLEGIDIYNPRKGKIIKEIIENDKNYEFVKEKILLNTIRDILYYSTQIKDGEDVG